MGRHSQSYCPTCKEWGTPDWPCWFGRRALRAIYLSTLARNLATGAALCRAFVLGGEHRWWPGCGRNVSSLPVIATEPHKFVGVDYDCEACGEGWCFYLHIDREDEQPDSWPGCGSPAPERSP